jgi:hypothetical protein
MARSSEQISPELDAYAVAHSSPADEILTSLATETQRRYPDSAGMQSRAARSWWTTPSRTGG